MVVITSLNLIAEVIVRPTNIEDLSLARRYKTQQRVFIALLAVGTAGLGILLAAMIVYRELESARVKADFAANVSHELRSPITQIRLKGEALQLDLVFDDDDRQRHYDAIVYEAERLSRLVDNVLDFASIDRGVKKYSLRPDDLGHLLQHSLGGAYGAIKSKGLALEIDVPDDLPVVWMDRDAVAQVFTNLLSNAAKYGADGKWVGLTARVGLDGVDVMVSDRGIGISKADLDHVFDHFFRANTPDVRKRRGTGIGLSIVRYIVEAHGGTISVDSELGEGTTFTVTFPFQPPRDAGA